MHHIKVSNKHYNMLTRMKYSVCYLIYNVKHLTLYYVMCSL